MRVRLSVGFVINSEQFISAAVRAQAAYHVPAGVPAIKLDAMENPYGLPMELRDRWLQTLRTVDIHRYPAVDQYKRLQARIAHEAHVPAHAQVILGNGSDELLQMLFLALAPGVTVVAPTPTFVMYQQIATLLGRPFVGVPLDADFGLDLPAMHQALVDHAPALLFLAYPNNPTGRLYPKDQMDALLAIPDTVVVVDEAYYPFAQASMLGKLADTPHMIIVRTFSKQGLAGIRLGWLAADSVWTNELEKLRLPYNVSSLTATTVEFVLDYQDVLDDQACRIRLERERLYGQLAQKCTVWASDANFLLFRVPPTHNAGRIHAQLQKEGVLIKNLDGHSAPLRGCLRVTVGTPNENDAFLAALGRAL